MRVGINDNSINLRPGNRLAKIEAEPIVIRRLGGGGRGGRKCWRGNAHLLFLSAQKSMPLTLVSHPSPIQRQLLTCDGRGTDLTRRARGWFDIARPLTGSHARRRIRVGVARCCSDLPRGWFVLRRLSFP